MMFRNSFFSLRGGARSAPRPLALLAVALAATAAASVLLPTAAPAAGVAPQPAIVRRSTWGARATAQNPFGTMGSLNRAMIHHTGNASNYNTNGLADSQAIMRATQNWHMDNNGWSDIGYHFVLDKWGNIFEGLNGAMVAGGLPRGAHDAVNTNSFGYSVMGMYHAPDNQVFTTAAFNSLCAVIAWRMPSAWRPYGWPGTTYGTCGNSIGYVDGHRRVNCSTTCPGDVIYNNYLTSNLSGGQIRDEINRRVVGTTPWDAQFNGQSFPAVMAPGAQATMWLEYKNIGASTWANSGSNPVRLGCSNPRDSSGVFFTSGNWLNATRPTDMDQASVATNAIGRFSFVGTAPATPGYYRNYFELLAENITWFEGSGDGAWFGVNVAASGNNVLFQAENFTGALSGDGLPTQGADFFDNDAANQGGAYRTSGVDINALAGGGWALGYTNPGEWTRYFWNCTATGTYRFKVRYSNGGGTAQVNLQDAGANVAQLSLPGTGSYSTFTERTLDFAVTSTGMKELKLYTQTAPANYDWFALDRL